ncbi:MAG: hypothetical protein R3A52_32005 [Polyangiales bacterium]
MTHAAAVVALASGCYFDAAVGRVRASRDASAEVADVTEDAPDVAAVDVADAPSDMGVRPVDDPRREVSGLGSLAPAVSVDPGAPEDHFRLYYLGRDGALWMERRRASTLASVCAVSLGAPDGRAIAGRPAAGDRAAQVVIAPVREPDGRVQLWLREETTEGGACGGAFSPWAALPASPYEITSAPAVYQWPIGAQFPAGNTYVLASTRSGLAMLLRREGRDAWDPWTLVPRQPADVRVYGRPGVLEWGATLEVFALAETSGGRPSLFRTVYYADQDRWLNAWTDLPLQPDDAPASGVDARSFFPVSAEAEQWLVYMGASGRLWRRAFHLVGGDAIWSPWSALPAIARGEVDASPSAVSIGVARTAGVTSELIVTAVPPGERSLYVSRWSVTSRSFEPWSLAPDPLR